MSASNRIIFSLNNKSILKHNTQSTNKNIKELHTNTKLTKKLTKNLPITKPKSKSISKINTKLKSNSITRPRTHSQYTRKIKSQINKLYTDLYDNYILVLFLDSKNKTDFITKIKQLSLKLDNYKLTKTDIQNYKNLYSQLNKRVKKKYLTSKTKKIKTSKSLFKKLGGNIDTKHGGPYLQRLTAKGNQPITGDDMAKTMEEIITVLSDLRYLDDAKEAYGPTVLLNYFMGDTEDLKGYLRYKLLPKFVKTNGFPPSIEFKKIFERWDNITDLLNLYKNDKKIKNEWAVSQGLKPADVLKPTFIDKLATKIEDADQKYQKLKALQRFDLVRGI